MEMNSFKPPPYGCGPLECVHNELLVDYNGLIMDFQWELVDFNGWE
jgi:hypothetical protein